MDVDHSDEDHSVNNEDDIAQESFSESNPATLQEETPLPENDVQTKAVLGKRKPLLQVAKEKKIKHSKSNQNQVTLEDVNKSAFEYFQMKKQTPQKTSTDNDADSLFLLSVLPDMKKMTDRQKRKFKVGILNLAGQILDEASAESPATTHCSTASHSSWTDLRNTPTLYSPCASSPAEQTFTNICVPTNVTQTSSDQHLVTSAFSVLYERT